MTRKTYEAYIEAYQAEAREARAKARKAAAEAYIKAKAKAKEEAAEARSHRQPASTRPARNPMIPEDYAEALDNAYKVHVKAREAYDALDKASEAYAKANADMET